MKTLDIFYIVLILFAASSAFAQETAGPGQAPNFSQLIEKMNNPLQRVLAEVKTSTAPQGAAVDNNTTEAIVRTLKNPFVSKLPKVIEVNNTSSKPVSRPTTDVHPQVSNPEVPRPNFTISGLVWNSPKPQAIINGQVLKLGDTVNNWTITRIGKNGVEVTSQNVTFLIEP